MLKYDISWWGVGEGRAHQEIEAENLEEAKKEAFRLALDEFLENIKFDAELVIEEECES